MLKPDQSKPKVAKIKSLCDVLELRIAKRQIGEIDSILDNLINICKDLKKKNYA